MKRTVVDWSFSFFMTLESSNGTMGPSLPKSSKESEETFKRYLRGIALRRISVNIGFAIRKVMYKVKPLQFAPMCFGSHCTSGVVCDHLPARFRKVSAWSTPRSRLVGRARNVHFSGLREDVYEITVPFDRSIILRSKGCGPDFRMELQIGREFVQRFRGYGHQSPPTP